ncbi:MAG: DUF202 domain-containing protein [Corynebacterium sp.]|nr:DUF202 domain-containing protein [Corynebacterium sp.]
MEDRENSKESSQVLPTPEPERQWLSTVLFPTGQDPDPSFTLANEQTFLAWIRTAVAFLAGGIGADAFANSQPQDPQWRVIALVLPLVALIISVSAVVRWIRIERSLRQRKSLPVPSALFVMALAVFIAAAVTVYSVVGA